jgi:hypothetical protein
MSITSSGTISSILIKKQTFSFRKMYGLYANSDTSFIIKYVLSQFIHNDPILNRCVIDLLDSLMTKSQKCEYIFHMNLAISLANIATLDNFKVKKIQKFIRHKKTQIFSETVKNIYAFVKITKYLVIVKSTKSSFKMKKKHS